MTTTRWWERAGATVADCPICRGDGLPDGCMECGEVLLPLDDPIMWHRAQEERAVA